MLMLLSLGCIACYCYLLCGWFMVTACRATLWVFVSGWVCVFWVLCFVFILQCLGLFSLWFLVLRCTFGLRLWGNDVGPLEMLFSWLRDSFGLRSADVD